MSKRSHALLVLDPIALDEDFEFLPGVPATRAECVDAPRPCPFVSCRHHLWLIEQRDRPGNPARGAQGAATLRPIGESCSLDVAVKPRSLQEVAVTLGVVPTRVHQITLLALAKLRALGLDVDDMISQVRRALIASMQSAMESK